LQQITALRGWSDVTDRADRSTTGTSNSALKSSQQGTSLSTALEQDFTVPGRKSKLLCPFAVTQNSQHQNPQETGYNPDSPLTPPGQTGTDPQDPQDPMCAALYAGTMSSPPPSATGSAAKCPIRFLDQHSPEEVAQYFESHKHEIPRSHEVCVKRYQRNEDDIRKLDAKYGNLVNMIQGLGQKHQPMLPTNEGEVLEYEADKKSNERVESWAKAVSMDGVDEEEMESLAKTDEDRESRFDRPLKEIRVGESPSRPWGISVPYVDGLPTSSAPTTVASKMPVPPLDSHIVTPPQPAPSRPAGKCPFGHGAMPKAKVESEPDDSPRAAVPNPPPPEAPKPNNAAHTHPNFLQGPDFAKLADRGAENYTSRNQIVFTGPVFIGYPVEQAVALLRELNKGV